MLFRIPRILSAISRVMVLEKGDVVLTGTPKGVGSVLAGDVMRAGVRVGGKEVEEGRVEVEVRDRDGGFDWNQVEGV
jgi:2-keto-4-pentenoate hydratase/2-oxohepta-3-ene-1,7-dioic acid hydratase in catechol pathway